MVETSESRMSDQNTTRGRQLNYANESLWEKRREERGFEGYNPLPVKINGSLTLEQMTAYQTMFRIQEITATLRSNNFEPPSRRNRSPSPPPAYDARGKRINTREQRYKRKLEEERHRLVEIALKMIPHFVAPEGYKRPVKFQDKYYIPTEAYPEINFVGLLLGPRGNTLKKLQEESGCKIAIRGRGSVKEGKNANDLPRGAMNFSDPLHCLIIADSEDKIQRGIKGCESIICKAVTSPEGQNDLKRGQLRELAELNGTLREDNRPCPICGLQGHKRYECPNKETFAQKITCRRCGQHGHATIDCIMTVQPQPVQESRYGGYPGNPRYAAAWQEQGLRNDYQQQVGVSSYRSRQARGTHEPETAYSAPHTTQKSYDYPMEKVDSVLSPPGLNTTESAGVDWGIPGMSSSSLPAASSDKSDIGRMPPGMDASPSGGLPGLESLPTVPGLSGPPGLPGFGGNEAGSRLNNGIEGPPGL
ncbi:hypothetical protein HG536_0C01450 [Torulaspora globosa]|uniref:Branchpoint-bridging protein n=1 Tax=Torulaspora globosa TaxID=48254 RepID=A0A7G3ZEP1_9SACH|nr:uncharacterized protein HG536_0C01450 [Torulaspora globosa]QLL31977.1 hypothetical protein HG536_0C01450 [Torulaspora globosa]